MTHWAYEWTKAHNIKRCLHGLGPKAKGWVRWNQAAVEGPNGAQAWADRGVFEHNAEVFNLTAPAGPADENIGAYVSVTEGAPRVVRVNYCGFSKKWDEDIPVGVGRLRPLEVGPIETAAYENITREDGLYIVEKVTDVRSRGGRCEYLTSWEG